MTETRAPIWRIRGENSNVHVFGQAPWGVSRQVAWLPDLASTAFDASSEFWCEVTDDDRLGDPELISRFGVSSADLFASLDHETRAAVELAAQELALDPASLGSCRPWLAAQILDHAMRDILFDEELLDCEREMTTRARARGMRTNFEFPGAEQVFTYFSTLGRAEIQYLTWTADRVLRTDDVPLQARAWLGGELAAFEDEVLEMERRWPDLYEVLLVRRNHAWLPRVHTMLTDREDSFVVMGMSHLVGHDGVLELLAAQGVTVERLP